jgi:bacillithiol system protein YtxJ
VEKRHPDVTFAMLIVQEDREVSREIMARTSIRHESPQVILFVDGQPGGVLNHEEASAANMEKLLGPER